MSSSLRWSLKRKMTEPSEQDCRELLRELRLAPSQGCVGIGERGFFVMIFGKVRKPPMTKFRGWPIRYHIGGGIPEALSA